MILFSRVQDYLHEVAAAHGAKDETYQKALSHIQTKSRAEGIDAALKYTDANNKTHEFDALLLCDRSGSGQQLAAQAGKFVQDPQECSFHCWLWRLSHHLHPNRTRSNRHANQPLHTAYRVERRCTDQVGECDRGLGA